jgi:hypothetical protein
MAKGLIRHSTFGNSSFAQTLPLHSSLGFFTSHVDSVRLFSKRARLANRARFATTIFGHPSFGAVDGG